MIRILKNTFLSCLCALTVFGAGTAQAQFMTGLLGQGDTMFGFIHIPEADDNLMHMFFMNPTPVQGCAEITPFTVEHQIHGVDLHVSVEFPVVIPDRKVRNPHYECNKGAQVANTVFALNKAELIEKGVNKMTLKTNISTMRYDMDLNENRVILTPPTPDFGEEIEYWFIPDDAIVLRVPTADEDIRDNSILMDQLNSLAALRNLQPIEHMKPGFTIRVGDKDMHNSYPNHFIFIDDKNIYRSTLEEQTYIRVGSIETTETKYGPEGKFESPKDLPVYAMRVDMKSR